MNLLEFFITADANTNFFFNTIFWDSTGVGATLITEYFATITTVMLKFSLYKNIKRYNTWLNTFNSWWKTYFADSNCKINSTSMTSITVLPYRSDVRHEHSIALFERRKLITFVLHNIHGILKMIEGTSFFDNTYNTINNILRYGYFLKYFETVLGERSNYMPILER